MEPFKELTGIAVAIPDDDVNTDQISPVGNVTTFDQDYAELLFYNRRHRDDGSLDPDFPLNKAEYSRPSFLVTGANFGCGSSREHAVWAIKAVGIRCVIGPSFALFFRENCLQNGVLPVTLAKADWQAFVEAVGAAEGKSACHADLVACTVTSPDGRSYTFEIPETDRLKLLEGLDEIGLTLKHADQIAAWEMRTKKELPWLQSVPNAKG